MPSGLVGTKITLYLIISEGLLTFNLSTNIHGLVQLILYILSFTFFTCSFWKISGIFCRDPMWRNLRQGEIFWSRCCLSTEGPLPFLQKHEAVLGWISMNDSNPNPFSLGSPSTQIIFTLGLLVQMVWVQFSWHACKNTGICRGNQRT